MQTSEKIDLITTALIECQKEIGPAIKDSTNPHFKSKYADLAGHLSIVKGPLNRHGILLTQTTDFIVPGGLCCVTRLTHTSGQWIQSIYPIVPTKQDPQQYGSAYSYAKRYSLAAILGIETEDDDGEQAMGRQPSPSTVTNFIPQNVPQIKNMAPVAQKEQTQTRPSPPLPPAAIPIVEPPKSSWVQAVTEASKVNHDPIGDYTPTFGKFKGIKIRDVIIHDLNSYVQYLQKSAAESNKPLGRNASEFISEVSKFIKTRTPMPTNKQDPEQEPSIDEINKAFMENSDIPF